MDVVVPIPQSAGQATLGETIVEARRLLEQAGIESAEQEALWIVEHVLRLPAHYVVTDRERLLSPAELMAAKELVKRRAEGTPVAEDYQPKHSKFTGTIRKVVVDVKEMGAGEKAEAKKAGADAARKVEEAK
jgi:hypothetical protein